MATDSEALAQRAELPGNVDMIAGSAFLLA